MRGLSESCSFSQQIANFLSNANFFSTWSLFSSETHSTTFLLLFSMPFFKHFQTSVKYMQDQSSDKNAAAAGFFLFFLDVRNYIINIMTFLGSFVFSSNTKPVDLNDKDSFSRISNLILFFLENKLLLLFVAGNSF